MDKDQIDDMLKFAEKESNPRGSDLKKRSDDKPRFFHSRVKTLYIGGAIVIVMVIVVTFLSWGGSDLSKADFNALMTRVDRIEVRLANMGGIEEKMTAALQAQKTAPSEGSIVASGTDGTMAQQLDLLTRKVELLQQQMGSIAEKAQVKRTDAAQRLQPKKTRYHLVASGETLYRIAMKYGLTVDKLRDLNKMTPPQHIYPGQKLLVSAEKDL